MSLFGNNLEILIRDDLRFGRYSGGDDNDLQLAARLGQSLLDRNIDLENQLLANQNLYSEQSEEISLLKRQISSLKSVSESQQQNYEEMDKNCLQLEQANDQLIKDGRHCRDNINRLTEQVERLEERYGELEEAVKEREIERGTDKKRNRVRCSSVPSVTYRQTNERTESLTGFSPARECSRAKRDTDEATSLHRTLRSLQLQLSMERCRRKKQEQELAVALSDQRILTERLDELSSHVKSDSNSITSESKHTSELLLADCSEACSSLDDEFTECCCNKHNDLDPEGVKAIDMIEHDVVTVSPSKGQLVRCRNGICAYGSKESLSVMGIEVDETPVSHSTPEGGGGGGEGVREDIDSRSFSLLGEYERLAERYEALAGCESSEIGEITSCDLSSEVNVSGRGPQLSVSCQTDDEQNLDSSSHSKINKQCEENIPEYKRLFKEIFDTLHRSRLHEDNKAENP